MALKPALPKGTRDLLPLEMQRRDYITSIIAQIFRRYGYQKIETPALEKAATLSGKYGEEGDRLIFKILPRGQKLEKAREKLREGEANALENSTEEALRYDLTVPFARFVVQHQSELTFPFRRFQIQPVWRADRPQKGRYREFVQCDADAVGSDSLFLDLELLAIYHQVFAELKLPVKIRLNHRKFLAGLAEFLNVSDKLDDFTVALDKLDKIGVKGVQKEMQERGLPEGAQEVVGRLHQQDGSASQALEQGLAMVGDSKQGQQGLEELRFLLQEAQKLGVADSLELDFALARGLDYYTGTIMEVVPRELEMGSLGGGGRYDNLTGIFGKEGLSGIGISFGLDRIYLALSELDLFPDLQSQGTELLFINFGSREAIYSLELAQQLRSMGRHVELYPEAVKVKKQLDYANRQGIPQVVMIGEEEIRQGRFTLKNMEDGSQRQLGRIELLEAFNHQSSHSHHGQH